MIPTAQKRANKLQRKHMKIRGLHIFIVLVAVITFGSETTVYAAQLVIPGTGANEVILKELAAVFNAENPEHEVIIPPSVGSGGGIRLAGTGENILGRVARGFKDDELQHNLEYLVFAQDMVIFVVGENVGVKNLSAQQLADVFSGKIENWQEVGGKDFSVRLLIREPGDSSLLIIKQKLESFKGIKFSERAKTLFHDYEMVKALNKYTTVIGWLTQSSMQDVTSSAKAIDIDNISPTQENVLDGLYVLTGNHALVYRKENLDKLASQFINFIFSKEGSRILINRGLVPVNR
jgi:phosphate transport system substrate-binding protein